MTDERDLCWVARFRTHPLGGVRYARDFYRWWLGCTMWREQEGITEEKIKGEIQFYLEHEKFHLSTEDLQSADLVFAGTRELYEKWLEVEMVSVSLAMEPVS